MAVIKMGTNKKENKKLIKVGFGNENTFLKFSASCYFQRKAVRENSLKVLIFSLLFSYFADQ